jgi:GNAT superfamily N-acetyltransferase
MEESNTTYSIISYSASTLPIQYVNMIFSKWLRSLRYGNDYFKLINSDAYFLHYNEFVFRILKNPAAIIRLAVLTDTPDVVLGWSISRGPILDFIHVHKDQRKQGIGTALMPKGISTITHITRIGMSIWSSKYPELIFNPFA